MKKIVELEGELAGDVGIVELFDRQRDGEANVEALGFRRAPVGGLHDAGPTASADHESAPIAGQPLRPFGQPLRHPPCIVVVARHAAQPLQAFEIFAFGVRRREARLGILRRGDPRRAEEHDRVLDPVVLEPRFGLDILRQYAQRSSLADVQKSLALVGLVGHRKPLGHRVLVV